MLEQDQNDLDRNEIKYAITPDSVHYASLMGTGQKVKTMNVPVHPSQPEEPMPPPPSEAPAWAK